MNLMLTIKPTEIEKGKPVITSFPNKKTTTSSDQATNPANTPAGNKIVRFANIQHIKHDKTQYDQAKQAINQAASTLNW